MMVLMLIGQWTASFKSASDKTPKEPGVLKELWSGFVDDILGPKGPKVAV